MVNTMKKLFLSLFAVLPMLAAMAAAPRFTADFYKMDPASYMDKVVTLKVTSAKPSAFEAEKGFVSFYLGTAYQKEAGGYIYALVAADKAKTFGRNYGKVKARGTIGGMSSVIPTKDVKGVFTQVELRDGAKEYVIIIK